MTPTEQAPRRDELLLLNARWLTEGDRKKERTNCTSQDKDISNAFHVNNS